LEERTGEKRGNEKKKARAAKRLRGLTTAFGEKGKRRILEQKCISNSGGRGTLGHALGSWKDN